MPPISQKTVAGCSMLYYPSAAYFGFKGKLSDSCISAVGKLYCYDLDGLSHISLFCQENGISYKISSNHMQRNMPGWVERQNNSDNFSGLHFLLSLVKWRTVSILFFSQYLTSLTSDFWKVAISLGLMPAARV